MSDTVRQITYLVSTHVYTARADTTNHQLTSAEPSYELWLELAAHVVR